MYTTTDKVYALMGITSSEITTGTVTEYIIEAEAEVDRIIKTTCKPKITVQKFNGNGENVYCLRQTPLLNIISLNIDDTDVSTKHVDIKQSGEAYLTNEAEVRYWSTKENGCKVVYLYGRLEEDRNVTQEVLTSDLEAGTRTIDVTDSDDYPANDYIKIEGIDGNYEVVKIKTSGTNKISVDLTQDHASGSILTKMKVPQIVQNLASVLAAIKGANYMIGNTYTFATSYSMPDYSVTKGVPHPHWSKSLDEFVKQRDYYISQLIPEPVFS